MGRSRFGVRPLLDSVSAKLLLLALVGCRRDISDCDVFISY